MQDPTLAAVLAACVENPQDKANVAALADRLLECSPQDRVEVLSRLTDSANRLALIKTLLDRMRRQFTLCLEVGVAPLDGGRVRKDDFSQNPGGIE